MRNSTPAFALLVLLSVWFTPAFSAQLRELMPQGCGATAGALTGAGLDNQQRAQNNRCVWAARTLVKKFGAQGGSDYKFPTEYDPGQAGEALPENWNGLSAQQFNTQATSLEKVLNEANTMASQCCPGQSGCENLLGSDNNPARAARARITGAQGQRTGGLNGSANAMTSATDDNVVVNSAASGMCHAAKQVCKSQQEVISKWSNGSTCTNCNPESKKAQLESLAKNCAATDAQPADKGVEQMVSANGNSQAAKQASENGQQGDKTGSNTPGDNKKTGKSGGGGGDGGMGAMLPMMAMQALQAMNQQQQQPQQMDQQTAQALGCEAKDMYGNSVVAGCVGKTAAVASYNAETGSGSSSTSASPASTTGFNLADNADAGVQPASVGGGGGGGGVPITTHGVANGGGGGIPGAGGGGGGATLGSSGGGGGGGGAKSNIPELRESGGPGGGGGLASTNASMSMQTGGGSGGYNYGGGAGGDFERIPLADFLPGGAKYAGPGEGTTASLARGLAGVSGPGMQIQSKSVNIWLRISEQIQSRCAQGRLRDCGP